MTPNDIQAAFEARQSAVHQLRELADETRDREMTGDETQTIEKSTTTSTLWTAPSTLVFATWNVNTKLLKLWKHSAATTTSPLQQSRTQSTHQLMTRHCSVSSSR
jgi:hypothetical protein